MEKITSLYPQYKRSHDRRQQNIPVAVERRSGKDRRVEDRVVLDSQLTRDIFEVKSKVAKIEALKPALFSHQVTTQSPNFASMNNFTQDQLVKSTKPDNSEIARREAQLQDRASSSFKLGVLAATLAGALVIGSLGPTGALVAIGTSLYVGAKVLTVTMERELKDKKDTKKVD